MLRQPLAGDAASRSGAGVNTGGPLPAAPAYGDPDRPGTRCAMLFA